MLVKVSSPGLGHVCLKEKNIVLQVVRHLIAAGHDVHVVTGAPEFVFTTEIQSPNLHIRKVGLDTEEVLGKPFHQGSDGSSGHAVPAFRDVIDVPLVVRRFAISIFTAWYGRYILVHQVAGTWTARYRAVPPKIDCWRSISVVDSRLKGEIDRRRSIKGEIDRRQSIEQEKGRKKKRKKKKKRKEEKKRPKARVRSSPARRPRPWVVVSVSPARGERSRRPRPFFSLFF
ncbi:hypothetical protein B296_00048351 [Ensete ventricosum]|uniref:Uncharacterized protein n=1 Tax=Ensete ventricosum TaxID=4639 RepID=A0A426YBN7_ENSVE|nr:hypothetical protein B296_00048351 [Ensete ventricosum]